MDPNPVREGFNNALPIEGHWCWRSEVLPSPALGFKLTRPLGPRLCLHLLGELLPPRGSVHRNPPFPKLAVPSVHHVINRPRILHSDFPIHTA